MKTLSTPEINLFLQKAEGWKYINNSIEKNFVFKNCNGSFNFIIAVATLAQKKNHHPDWSGTGNNVYIKLSSHDAKGVTERDIELAKEIEILAT